MNLLTQQNRDYSLKNFLNSRDEFDVDPLSVPVHLAGSEQWGCMNPERRNRVLGGMLRHAVKRAVKNVPLYRDDIRWRETNPDDIADIGDLANLPVVSKDSVPGTGMPYTRGIKGFRHDAIRNPKILVPDNLSEIIVMQESANPGHENICKNYHHVKVLGFGSGGSQGTSTKTLLPYLTIEMEAYALARALAENGLKEGQSIACMYAPDHKGGLQLQRAAAIMGMEFHSKNKIFGAMALDQEYQDAAKGFKVAVMRGDQDAVERFAPKVREGIREYIRRHRIQVVESVQPPDEFMQKNAKGSGLAFMSIYEEDPSAFETVEHIFLTGFTVSKRAYTELQKDGIEVSTTWGSTETMALATYSGHTASGNVNDLQAVPFPTVGYVAWYKERGLYKPRLEPVPEGLEGILLVTSLLAAGSTYINYMIGDIATKTERGYKDIHRISTADISGSCAADALSL